MNEDAKTVAARVWDTLKPEIERLAARITALYEAAGSARHCRHINELWHPENPAVGIGFVPPEAIGCVEALVIRSGFHLHKGNGPLGKGVYFSLRHDAQLTADRLQRLGDMVDKETTELKGTPPKPKPTTAPEPSEDVFEERVEDLTAMRGDKLRTRPAQVASTVDAFNGATMDMTPAQALKLLATAIPYFEHLPDISRNELLHTLKMMQDAEKKN